MRATQFAFLTLIIGMLCGTHAVLAQTKPTGRAAAPENTATRDEEIATWTKTVQDYQEALNRPDIASDPYRAEKTNNLLIKAKCQLEALELPPALTQDAKFKDGLLAACSDRLHDQAHIGSVVGTNAPSLSIRSPATPPVFLKTGCSTNSQSKSSGSDTKYTYSL